MKNGSLPLAGAIFRPQLPPPFSLKNNHSSSCPDPFSISSTIQHYIDSESPSLGQKIHAHILKIGFKPNTNISIKLLILYVRSGCLNYARRMFDELPKPSISSYNSLLSGYMKRGRLLEALEIIQKLACSDQRPDAFTFSMILKVSTSLSWLNLAKQVHSQVMKSSYESDDVIFTGLVDSYAKNGKINYARKVYDKMSQRTVICCTAMISGYMRAGLYINAEEILQNMCVKDVVVYNAMIEGYSKTIETSGCSVEIFKDMQRLKFLPTISTFVSVIGACSILSEVEVGQQLHSQLVKKDILLDVRLGSALIDMYSKCGRIEDARRVFDEMRIKNVFSWTSMIDGYGKNGNSEKALQLFGEMRQACHVKPNHVTFLSVLSSCGHTGSVSEGWEIFQSMERDYSLKPRMEHYACMVDILGRAGSLQEALEFIKQMAEQPHSDVWAALLGASRLHGDVAMADLAASELFKLSIDGRPGAYVALSNTFAAAEKWDSVSEVRELMKERGVSKDVGCCWIGTESGSLGS